VLKTTFNSIGAAGRSRIAGIIHYNEDAPPQSFEVSPGMTLFIRFLLLGAVSVPRPVNLYFWGSFRFPSIPSKNPSGLILPLLPSGVAVVMTSYYAGTVVAGYAVI